MLNVTGTLSHRAVLSNQCVDGGIIFWRQLTYAGTNCACNSGSIVGKIHPGCAAKVWSHLAAGKGAFLRCANSNALTSWRRAHTDTLRRDLLLSLP
jgi:hypothetical protein